MTLYCGTFWHVWMSLIKNSDIRYIRAVRWGSEWKKCPWKGWTFWDTIASFQHYYVIDWYIRSRICVWVASVIKVLVIIHMDCMSIFSDLTIQIICASRFNVCPIIVTCNVGHRTFSGVCNIKILWSDTFWQNLCVKRRTCGVVFQNVNQKLGWNVHIIVALTFPVFRWRNFRLNIFISRFLLLFK